MADVRGHRIAEELVVAAFGRGLGTVPWVTDRLLGMLEEHDLAPGEGIFAQGDPPEHFYFVRQGSLALTGGAGPAEIVAGPRAFGLIDALLERPRPRSARAVGPTQLLVVPVEAWFELLEDSFELARMSIVALARAVSAMQEQVWARGASAAEPSRSRPPATLDVVDRTALLMRTPLLRGAGVQAVSDLAAHADEVRFAGGQEVFEAGAPPSVTVLVEGRVTATRRAPDVTWSGAGGEIVCGAASLAGTAPQWSALASEASRALTFRIADWFDLMEEDVDLVRAVMTALAAERERLLGEGGGA